MKSTYIVGILVSCLSLACFASENNQVRVVSLADVIQRAKDNKVDVYNSEQDIPGVEKMEIEFHMYQARKAGKSYEEVLVTGYGMMLKCYNLSSKQAESQESDTSK